MQAGTAWVMHVPPLHTCPGPHDTQAEPCWPQAESVVLVTHELPLQHPLQLVALQTVPPLQTPPAHVEPFWQALQVLPLTPQLRLDCEAVPMHDVPTQQPAQLKKSQLEAAPHTPLEHDRPTSQALHAAPAVPQMPSDWLP